MGVLSVFSEEQYFIFCKTLIHMSSMWSGYFSWFLSCFFSRKEDMSAKKSKKKWWFCSLSLLKLNRRAVFQHDKDPKHTSQTTTALLKELRVKVMDWLSMTPDPNPIGYPKQKVEERKVSNIHQLLYVVQDEWKRIPVAACGALVYSMPNTVKAINNGGHTKY